MAITDEIRDRAVELVQAGASCRAVAAVLGIHPSTVARACAAEGILFAPGGRVIRFEEGLGRRSALARKPEKVKSR